MSMHAAVKTRQDAPSLSSCLVPVSRLCCSTVHLAGRCSLGYHWGRPWTHRPTDCFAATGVSQQEVHPYSACPDAPGLLTPSPQSDSVAPRRCSPRDCWASCSQALSVKSGLSPERRPRRGTFTARRRRDATRRAQSPWCWVSAQGRSILAHAGPVQGQASMLDG